MCWTSRALQSLMRDKEEVVVGPICDGLEDRNSWFGVTFSVQNRCISGEETSMMTLDRAEKEDSWLCDTLIDLVDSLLDLRQLESLAHVKLRLRQTVSIDNESIGKVTSASFEVE